MWSRSVKCRFIRAVIYLMTGTVSFLVSGCHMNHEFHYEPIRLECTDLEEQVDTAFLTTSVVPGEFESDKWWVFFNDPQLNRLISLALDFHPDIKIASARLRLAAEEALHARAALYPHFNFEAEIFREKISDFVSIPNQISLFTDARLDLVGRYDLDLWNKKRSLFYAELDEVMAAFAEKRAAELMLASAIAEVYFDLQGKLSRLEIAKKRLEARENLQTIFYQQFQTGILDAFRFYEVDSEVALLKDLVLILTNDVDVDEHALAALVGNLNCCTNGALKVAPSADFHTPVPIPETLPLDLISRRPEITAQKWHIESNCYFIKAAQAAFYPNVNLVGFIGFQSIELSKLLQAQSLEYLVDAAFDLPIFNAGELQANLGVARENYEVAVEEYNQMVINAIKEVSDALSHLISADERKKNIQETLQDAEKLYTLSDLRYQNGIANQIPVLNSLENLYLQKDLDAQIQTVRLKSAAALFQAIGGGYHE